MRCGRVRHVVRTSMVVTVLASCGASGPTVDNSAVMKNVGFALAPFDAETGRAGDLVIDGVVPPIDEGVVTDPQAMAHNLRVRYLFLPFGWAEADGTDPQWNFVLPLGTRVISPVDGTVCEVPMLYSGDFSVRIAPSGRDCAEGLYFETEHVDDPVVKADDKVTAGQHVASVSSYQQDWARLGFGVVEIGVAFPTSNGPPLHVCPSLLLDPAVKKQLLDSLTSVMDAWSAEFGDADLYAGANDPEVGCYQRDVRA